MRFRDGIPDAERARALRRTGGTTRHRYDAPRGLELVELPAGVSEAEGLSRARRERAVERAEPDWSIHVDLTPNDPRLGEEWELENTGQTGGKVDADINATGAWSLTTGSPSVVVAVIDSGIDYRHPDLAANVWVNSLEVPGNGVDDDGNGWVDDVHGIDALAGTGDPMDDLGHGTEMAGLIAAAGNDGQGITGVGWSTRLLACKAIDATGSGKVSAALACMDYLRSLKRRAAAPVDIVAINASWGGSPYSQELADAIAATRAAGILFVTSAGNGGGNIEDATSLSYPARFGLPLVVSVGASDAWDRRASISDFGRTAVHLLSPGTSLLTLMKGGGYAAGSGTSHAAAVASGVVALVASQSPTRGPGELASLLLAGAQPIDGAVGVTATGRRLRAWDVGGVGSLSCAGQRLQVRVAPPGTTVLAVRGLSVVPLSVLHVDCDGPAGPPSVGVDGAYAVTLSDDASGSDLFAGDGVYSGGWAVPGDTGSSHQLTFSATDTVTVRTLEWYGPPATIPFEWRTVAGQELPLADDTAAEIHPPFAIPFGDAEGGFSTLWVHSNGYVDLSGTRPSSENEALPSRRLGTAVAPFWDDLDPGAAGSVAWDVLGAAPHRELVIEWNGVATYEAGPTGTLTFQVVLFEDRPDVVFSYADVSVGDARIDGGASATIGIQEAAPSAGGVATTFSTNAASVAAGTSLLWRTGQPSSQVPALALVPPAGSTPEGQTVEVELAVSDPEGAAAAPYRVTWSWGDGASDSVTLPAPGPLVLRHVFADDDGSPFDLEAHVTTQAEADGTPGPTSLTAVARVPLTVTNVPPRIEKVDVTPRATGPGQSVTITVVATDPGHDTLAYSFDFDGDGSYEVADSAAPAALGTTGSKGATVLVRDDDGGEARARATDGEGGDTSSGCGCAQPAAVPGPAPLLAVLVLCARLLRRRLLAS